MTDMKPNRILVWACRLSFENFNFVMKTSPILLLLLLGTGAGTAQSGPAIAPGACLEFESGAYVVVSNAPALPGVFTFEAWVFLNDTNRYHTILSRGAGISDISATDYIWQIIPGGRVGLFAGGAWDFSNVPVIQPSTWTHLAVSFDESFKIFYRNGRLVQGNSRPRAMEPLPATEPLYLGRQGSACNCNFLEGRLDEVRIWNGIRNGFDIADWYNRSLPGGNPSLAAYYRMDASSSTVVDSSERNHPGIQVGTVNRISNAGILSQFPSVASFTVSQPGLNQVKLEGLVSARGWETDARFVYGQSNTFNMVTDAQILGPFTTNGSVTTTLSQLPPGTYQARLIATNILGIYETEFLTFTVGSTPFGNALALASFVDVTITNAATLSDRFTFEAWAHVPDTDGFYTILSRGGGQVVFSATDYTFQIRPGGQVALFALGDWDVSGDALIEPNQWTHLAVTFDGTSKRFYRNGVLVRRVDRGGALAQFLVEEPLFLGRQGSACACNFFQGALDEVRIWNVARTDAEIAAGMNFPMSGPVPGLVGRYGFDEIQGATVNDASGQGRSGIIVNRGFRIPSGAGLGDTLRLTRIERNAQGLASLRIHTPFAFIIIDASSDLANWFMVGTVTAPASESLPTEMEFIDSTSANVTQRFYRVRPD